MMLLARAKVLASALLPRCGRVLQTLTATRSCPRAQHTFPLRSPARPFSTTTRNPELHKPELEGFGLDSFLSMYNSNKSKDAVASLVNDVPIKTLCTLLSHQDQLSTVDNGRCLLALSQRVKHLAQENAITPMECAKLLKNVGLAQAPNDVIIDAMTTWVTTHVEHVNARNVADLCVAAANFRENEFPETTAVFLIRRAAILLDVDKLCLKDLAKCMKLLMSKSTVNFDKVVMEFFANHANRLCAVAQDKPDLPRHLCMITNVLWSKSVDMPNLLTTISRRASEVSDSFDASDTAFLLNNLANFEHRTPHLPALFRRAVNLGPVMTHKQLSQVLRALHVLGGESTDFHSLLSQFCKSDTVNRADFESVAVVLNASAAGKVVLPPEMMATVGKRLVDLFNKGHNPNTKALLLIASAVSHYRYKQPALLNVLFDHAKERIDEFDSKSYTFSILDAMVRLDVDDDALAAALAKRLFHFHRITDPYEGARVLLTLALANHPDLRLYTEEWLLRVHVDNLLSGSTKSGGKVTEGRRAWAAGNTLWSMGVVLASGERLDLGVVRGVWQQAMCFLFGYVVRDKRVDVATLVQMHQAFLVTKITTPNIAREIEADETNKQVLVMGKKVFEQSNMDKKTRAGQQGKWNTFGILRDLGFDVINDLLVPDVGYVVEGGVKGTFTFLLLETRRNYGKNNSTRPTGGTLLRRSILIGFGYDVRVFELHKMEKMSAQERVSYVKEVMGCK